MQFEKSEGTAELEHALLAAIALPLSQNKKVLWLVPGGSNISVAVRVMNQIDAEQSEHLTVMLTDERFGAPGHANSNYTQLFDAGFQPKWAQFDDLLIGASLDATIQTAEESYKKACSTAEHIIGFFGLGSDGHIAGILPHSPAASRGENWVVGYEASPFIRMTLTPFALSHVQKAFVGAFGKEKAPALHQLREEVVPIEVQPAQILKHLPYVVVYNNQIGAL